MARGACAPPDNSTAIRLEGGLEIPRSEASTPTTRSRATNNRASVTYELRIFNTRGETSCFREGYYERVVAVALASLAQQVGQHLNKTRPWHNVPETKSTRSVL